MTEPIRQRLSRYALRLQGHLGLRDWRDSIEGDLEEELAREASRDGRPPGALPLAWLDIAIRLVWARGLDSIAAWRAGRSADAPGPRGNAVVRILEATHRNVWFGARLARKHPTSPVVAIASLALAIGANTAGFSVIDGVLLRPAPGVGAPERLAVLFSGPPEAPCGSVSYPSSPPIPRR